MELTDKDRELILTNCNKSATAIPDKDIKGEISIEDLLQKGFEKHVGSFEIPDTVKNVVDIDEINAVISWYLPWKLSAPLDKQNTCTIKDTFGYEDGVKAIIAINFFKYLRNKGYDPDIVEIFLKQQ